MRPAPIGVVRWGAEVLSEVAATSTRPVPQFVDFAIDVPGTVDIVLVATSNVPVAGLSVKFILQIGIGSTNHEERLTFAVQDIDAQTPIVLRRSISRIQISAATTNITPDLRQVRIFAAVAPQYLECGELR